MIEKEKRKVKVLTALFMFSLVVSGLTAIPVKQELDWLLRHLPQTNRVLVAFLQEVRAAVAATPPLVFYAFDWLAFVHIVIAVNFIGVWIDPVKNKWVIQFGFIACAMVLPFAWVMGSVRGLPLWWQMIDASFGVGRAVVLVPLYNAVKKLEKYEREENSNIMF